MTLKKIYLEITNSCNLNCSFCIKNKRKVTSISKENYEYIINKIKNHTKEIYLHILGEPLMHKDINYLIDYASNNGLLVNITTNGYLIKKIDTSHNINRLNISLHSFQQKYGKELNDYLSDIFDTVDKLRDKTFVTVRLWVNGKYTNEIIRYISSRYQKDLKEIPNNMKVKITNNLIIDTFHEFIWPDLNNDYYSSTGTCMGLRDHIGILSNGVIVPCCLDSRGIIALGNIYEDDLNDIFKSERVKKMIDGFRQNKKYEELCKHCHFLEK